MTRACTPWWWRDGSCAVDPRPLSRHASLQIDGQFVTCRKSIVAREMRKVSDAPDTSEAARPKLFQPFTIRGLTLKNRLVVPPMVHYRAEAGNTCGTFHVVHLGRYALGRFGLVFVEATAVEEVGL